MFTSRAEYRLLIRSDNADLRLMDYGHGFGLISDDMHQRFSKYRGAVASAAAHMSSEFLLMRICARGRGNWPKKRPGSKENMTVTLRNKKNCK